ncbi:hypothetical protein O1611_g4923 [Lasiodiplodia mahajangana]|uniref:Uncharacterized protein n=1 Tax=Lasiodiplodia mahajangana TaxID=1108764 RepID=A0ACC2JMR3_9PEZI|nr:hypothetical protein O1611_g4923 [Lasiodiplodia mahajangana]
MVRNGMDADIIGICQILRSWYRAGIAKELDKELLSFEKEVKEQNYCSLDNVELKAEESKWLREHNEETGVDRALEDEDGVNSNSEDNQGGTGGLED